MIRELITIPDSLFKTTTFNWDIDFRSEEFGGGLDGGEGVMVSAFPRWIGSPSLVLHGSEISQFRAIRWHAMGRAGVYRVKMHDPCMSIEVGPENGNPFSTGERFSTGSGFAYDPFYTCAKSAAQGSDVLQVNMPSGAPEPQPGQIVSDRQDWPIAITSVTALSSTKFELTVKPYLRAAIASGDAISMEATGRFVAVGDLVGNPEFGLTPHSRPQLQFREYLLR